MTQSEMQKRLAHYQKLQEELEMQKQQQKKQKCWLCRFFRGFRCK